MHAHSEKIDLNVNNYMLSDERCQSLSDASTQTTASWKQGDEQNTSMLPSKNSSSVPMKVSQGANMPTQVYVLFDMIMDMHTQICTEISDAHVYALFLSSR
jgi:hypothetical protein